MKNPNALDGYEAKHLCERLKGQNKKAQNHNAKILKKYQKSITKMTEELL